MQHLTGVLRQQGEAGSLAWLSNLPTVAIDAAHWAIVRAFVTDCADRLGLTLSPSSARVVRVVTRFAAWSLAEGQPLDRDVLLDPANVERFVASLPAGNSRATYRSILRRIGPLLTTKAPWEPRPSTMARRQVAPPYSGAELSTLCRDALSQPTGGRQRGARALLALGVGAGLDGRWISKVTADDVVASAWGVLVRVGEPSPRVVPVLASWECEVLDLANLAGAEFLIGGHSVSRNRASNLAASLEVAHGHPRFSASRMRSTWLVTHMRMGTRLPELAKAAGLAGVTVLSDLLEHVPPVGECEAVQMLRGLR